VAVLVVVEEGNVEQRVAQLLGLHADELQRLVELRIAGLVHRLGALPSRVLGVRLRRDDVELAVRIRQSGGIHGRQIPRPHHGAVEAVEGLPVADGDLQPTEQRIPAVQLLLLMVLLELRLRLRLGVARVVGSGAGAIADRPGGADGTATQETALPSQLGHTDAVVFRTLRRPLTLLAAKEEGVGQLPFAAIDEAAYGSIGPQPEAILPLQSAGGGKALGHASTAH